VYLLLCDANIPRLGVAGREQNAPLEKYVDRHPRGAECEIDVGIGMAKFQHAYYPGFMPKVGCPGCNGDTMEYVEQDE
jgi:hypothetical protein